jgi:hypothetical protein
MAMKKPARPAAPIWTLLDEAAPVLLADAAEAVASDAAAEAVPVILAPAELVAPEDWAGELEPLAGAPTVWLVG